MSERNVEIRGYVYMIGPSGFKVRTTDSSVKTCMIMHNNPRLSGSGRSKDLGIGTIVSCVVSRFSAPHSLIAKYDLVSIEVSDYKAKRKSGSVYFIHKESYVFEGCEHILSAFVNKDGNRFDWFDYGAIDSFDSEFLEWFFKCDISSLEKMRDNDSVLRSLKFEADRKAFISAMDTEIAYRIQAEINQHAKV